MARREIVTSQIEQVQLSESDFERAMSDSEKMGVLNKSYTSGKGNLVGHLGEIAACKYLGAEYGNSTYEYDFIHNGLKVDVKTRNCTSQPRSHYFVGVNTCTKKQDCDVYVFARVLTPNHDCCWLLGWMDREEFYKAATFYAKGTVDPYGDGTFTFKEDGYQLQISKLKPMRLLRESRPLF